MNINELASKIDHTFLKPNGQEEQILQLCQEAITYKFASVCVHPCWIKTCSEALKDHNIVICSVIGFPLGQQTLAIKVAEMKEAIELGAREVDYVVNLGYLKSNRWDLIELEMQTLRKLDTKVVIKVILETGYLNDEEITHCTKLAIKSRIDFVKTSTGFGPRGASLKDIELMGQASKGSIKIKASGGIRSLKDALSYLEKGVERLGTSSGVSILKELE